MRHNSGVPRYHVRSLLTSEMTVEEYRNWLGILQLGIKANHSAANSASRDRVAVVSVACLRQQPATSKDDVTMPSQRRRPTATVRDWPSSPARRPISVDERQVPVPDARHLAVTLPWRHVAATAAAIFSVTEIQHRGTSQLMLVCGNTDCVIITCVAYQVDWHRWGAVTSLYWTWCYTSTPPCWRYTVFEQRAIELKLGARYENPFDIVMHRLYRCLFTSVCKKLIDEVRTLHSVHWSSIVYTSNMAAIMTSLLPMSYKIWRNCVTFDIRQ